MRAARERGLTVKAVGAGHSFTDIAATDRRAGRPGRRSTGCSHVDAARGRVTLGAGTNLYQLPALLDPHGLALENMGDIDRQTIAGATIAPAPTAPARDSAGSPPRSSRMTLVTADGDLLHVSETENAELLPAVRLGLGALGIVVEVTLQCVPAFLLQGGRASRAVRRRARHVRAARGRGATTSSSTGGRTPTP